jgi:hypothetical protein
MPTGLFERYVGEMDPLHAEWLLDMATAADYAGWGKQSRERWWNTQVSRLRRGPSIIGDAPARRRAAFFWNGQALSGAELKQKAAGTLGSRLAA